MKLRSEECQGDIELTPQDTVIEVGGYLGQGAAHLAQSGAKILVFEPVFWRECAERVKQFRNVLVYAEAIGSRNEDLGFFVDGDRTGIYGDATARVQTVEMWDIKNIIENHGRIPCALLRINCEGGEYDILERLLETDLLPLFKLIQVQFHFLAPGHEERHWTIRQGLAQTHIENNPPHLGWETWRIKP